MSSRRPATDAQARALASSVRQRILRLCLHEARTNKELATALDRDPASVLHHVRTLVAAGLLTAQEERRGARGAREVPYRATGLSWELDIPPGLVDRSSLEAFLDEIVGAPLDAVSVARIGLVLDADGAAELQRRLDALFDEFVDRGPRPGGHPVSVLLATHTPS